MVKGALLVFLNAVLNAGVIYWSSYKERQRLKCEDLLAKGEVFLFKIFLLGKNSIESFINFLNTGKWLLFLKQKALSARVGCARVISCIKSL